MLFWKLLAVFLLPLQIALMLYRDWKHHDRRTRKYKRLTIIQIAIVFCAVVILGITLYLDNRNEEQLLGIISNLNDGVADLNTSIVEPLQKIAENTQETYFTLSEKKERRMENGSYEVSFQLEPVGRKTITLLKIQCKTQNNVKIESIEAKGSTLPAMSYDRKSEDRTYFGKEYRYMEPGKVEVTILTSSVPRGMNIVIDPFRKTEKNNDG